MIVCGRAQSGYGPWLVFTREEAAKNVRLPSWRRNEPSLTICPNFEALARYQLIQSERVGALVIEGGWLTMSTSNDCNEAEGHQITKIGW
jgi:hypothetical protein